jgi:hypothetical protein
MQRSNLCAATFRFELTSVSDPDVKIGVSRWLPETKSKESHLEPAGSELEKIVARSLRQAPPLEAPLMAWPVVCGSAVAERTRALSFADGVLRVSVPELGWKSELQALAPRYLAAINRYTIESVRKIEFVVTRADNTSKTSR